MHICTFSFLSLIKFGLHYLPSQLKLRGSTPPCAVTASTSENHCGVTISRLSGSDEQLSGHPGEQPFLVTQGIAELRGLASSLSREL